MSKSEIIQHLILKVSEGNEIAFARLYETFFAKIYSFTGCFIKSAEARKEVVSDVFLTIWNNRSRLTEIKNFESYVFIITRNKSVDYLDKYRQKPAYLEEESFEIITENDSPEDKILTKELEIIINKSINELPERCKLIYLMSRDEGFTYKEIAEILTLSEATINSQIVIALKKLGNTIKEYISLLF